MKGRFKQKIFSSLALLTILLPMMLTFVSGIKVLAAENTGQEAKKVIVDSQGDIRESGTKEIEIFDHPLGSGKLSYEKVTEERGTYFEWKLAVTKNGSENPYKLGFHITSDWEPIEIYSLLTTPLDIYEKTGYVYNQEDISDWNDRYTVSEVWEKDFGKESSSKSVIRFKTQELEEIEIKAMALVEKTEKVEVKESEAGKADEKQQQEEVADVDGVSTEQTTLTNNKNAEDEIQIETQVTEELLELNDFGTEVDIYREEEEQDSIDNDKTQDKTQLETKDVDDSKDTDNKEETTKDEGQIATQGATTQVTPRMSFFKMNSSSRNIWDLISPQKNILDTDPQRPSTIEFYDKDNKLYENPEEGVAADATVKINLNWALPNEVGNDTIDYRAGDFFTFQLPSYVKYVASSGPVQQVIDGKTIDFGKYEIDTAGLVTITFDKDISDLVDIKGTFTYEQGINKSSEPGEIVVNDPFYEKIPRTTIFLKPVVENSISKSGEFDQNPNPTSITWTVDFNKGLDKMVEATLTDNLDNQLEPTPAADVEVYLLEMNADGTVKGVGKQLEKDTHYTITDNMILTLKRNNL